MGGVNKSLLLSVYSLTNIAWFATPSHNFPKYQAAIQITFMWPKTAKNKVTVAQYNKASVCHPHPFSPPEQQC